MSVAAIAPLPASWPRVPPHPARLPECLALAVLVHLLLIAVFGNAPGGSARPGEGVWGSINIRLAGNGPPGPETPARPTPDAYSGPTGAASERRWGGRVRDSAAPPADNPGAARLGTWNPAPTARNADPLPPQPAPRPLTEPPLRELRDPGVPLRSVAPLPAAPAALADVPKIVTPPELAPAPPRPAETRTLAAPPALATESTRPLAPVAPVAPAESVPAPSTLPELQPPPALRSLPAPAALPAPSTAPLGRVAPAEAVTLPEAPPELRAPAPTRKLAAPPVAPAPNAAPLGRIAPLEPVPLPAAPPELRAPAPVETRSLPVPAPLPVDNPPLARPQPVEAPAFEAPASLPELRPLAPGAAPPPSAVPARPAEGLPRPAAGAPDAGAALGHDVATPPSEPASAPRLNLDLVRPRGGEISSQGSRGLVNLLPQPPERKLKLAEDIEKAAKPDCRTAYSGIGLFAAVPLVADAVRKDGCRW